MGETNFNSFAENDYVATVSLAEYRALVEENARLRCSIGMLEVVQATLERLLAKQIENDSTAAVRVVLERLRADAPAEAENAKEDKKSGPLDATEQPTTEDAKEPPSPEAISVDNDSTSDEKSKPDEEGEEQQP